MASKKGALRLLARACRSDLSGTGLGGHLGGQPKPGLDKHKSLNSLSFQTRAAKSNCIAATRKDPFDGNGRAYRMNWSLGDHQCSDEVKEKYQYLPHAVMPTIDHAAHCKLFAYKDPRFAPGHGRISMRTTWSKAVNTEHDIDEGAGSKTERVGRK
ncbi:hypothetical protein B0H13DRAFT_1898192 [Mycena leptocephala]|nr:hypothetical protein B0H13DRAFT_1898192 [Mycena leptocephala]